MIYTITFKNKLRPIIYPIIAAIVFTFFYLEIFIEAWHTEFRAFSIVVYVLFLVYTLVIPIVIHSNYKAADKGKKLLIDNDAKKLVISMQDAVLLDTQFSEVKEIIIHQTNKYKQRSVNWFSWAAYYYYEVILKSGESQKISRLLVCDLDKKISGLEFKYRNYFLPMI